ncbi:MAG TPA: hypothetical protein VK208_04615 [Pyrinomonadaceae bacterium]|jgi:hypothetical protein|nr:hypothetical protein [Pyrinomonadaceae bacterium]
MENVLGLLLLLDLRTDPVNPLPWGALILLLVFVFVLAVGLTAGIVTLLIRRQRRKARAAHPGS